MDDPHKRSALENIKSIDAQSNDVFNEARTISHEFEDALMRFFFDNENLKPLTRKYGVF